MADSDVRRANTAAQNPDDKPTGETGESRPTQATPSNRRNGAGRAIVAVLAVVVIAFCAWSMGEYVNGRDPLAFLHGSVASSQDASTSADGASTDDSSSSASEDATAKAGKVSELSSDDVANLLADGLSLDGDDVSVPKADVRVVLSESGVWVEQVDRDGAQALVKRTAQRAAALASWLAKRQERGEVSVGTVTWITEDAHGIVRMVVEDASDGAATSGDTKALLSSARAYLISADTYAELGAVGYPATRGEAPKLPDGTALQVDAAVRGGERDGSGSKAESTKLVRVTETSSAGGGNGGSAPTSDSAGGAGSSGGRSSRSGLISVRVSVGGAASTVSLPAGSTAYDALLATGASVEAGANPYGSGTWVYAINGRGQDASHGWTYSVNGSLPGVMSDLYTLRDGDSVSWNYVAG